MPDGGTKILEISGVLAAKKDTSMRQISGVRIVYALSSSLQKTATIDYHTRVENKSRAAHFSGYYIPAVMIKQGWPGRRVGNIQGFLFFFFNL